MKKLIFLFVCVFSIQVALADNDKPINFTQLPQAAQKFVKQHFPKAKIAFVKMETELFDKSYDVVFNNGDKLEFDKKGEWTEVNCKSTVVPAKVIPAPIKKYVETNYPEAKVILILLLVMNAVWKISSCQLVFAFQPLKSNGVSF